VHPLPKGRMQAEGRRERPGVFAGGKGEGGKLMLWEDRVREEERGSQGFIVRKRGEGGQF
jgi:hypothetical protein